ncbi:ABC transporter permease [Nesterenkonia ebinurensis]|uniref:ABC transporter permease n=1 Tax=Nesterenkonia ebinurensis TaxID=2608252 RepID=UPI001CC7444C|nr:ABC transporter permease [Nesterenkonia ebinurensis]
MAVPSSAQLEEVDGQAPGGGSKPPGASALKTILRKPSVIFSLAFLLIVTGMAVFAPWVTQLSGWGPLQFDESAVDSSTGGLPLGPWGGISADHWFGVEPQNGRDIFARIVYGARVSMLIAICATALTMLIGVTLGMLAGFAGGWVDAVISRLMDFLMAFPALIFMIAVLSAVPQGNRPLLLVLVLSLFSWPQTARVVRGQAMSITNREFVEAARASGAGRMTLVFKEVLPNLSGTVIVMATLAVPTFIATEAGLSFLGVGVIPPTPSWGQMIAQAVPWYASHPLFFAVPGIFLFLTVFSFTILGDNLQKVWASGGRS